MSDSVVYIIDDDAAVRKGLTLSLRERDYAVTSFPSAEQFLEARHLTRPACAIVDIRMPGMTGLELQDRMLERGLDIPIVFISAHGDIPMAVKAINKGAIDFLEKPYRLLDMLKSVDKALRIDTVACETRQSHENIRANYALLSAREREVMTMLVEGLANTSNREIAEKLGISRRTVDTYRLRLMQKMQAGSLPQLVDMARVCKAPSPVGPSS